MIEMRVIVWIIIGCLLIGALVFTIWPILMPAGVPGQYPLDAARFEWPMAERSKEFRPSKLMGSDTIKLPNKGDAKTRCALATSC